MFIDGREIPRGSTQQADLCIIGAGPAGITLARQLASERLSVLCIESGGLAPDAATQDLTRGEIRGLPYFPLHTTRLRYFGGASGHWGGYCRPFYPLDFETREWVPHSGWPIPYSAVARYYPAAQDICDLGPFDYSTAGWELGALRPFGFHDDAVQTRLIQFSPPTRFGTKYQAEFAGARHVRVLLHSNVVSIDTGEHAREVTGLAIRTLDGNAFRARARIYVLAAGGIENARLLLSSTGAAPAGLGNDHDLVGRYFADHMQLDCAAVLPLDDTAAFQLYQTGNRSTLFTPQAGGRGAGLMGYLTLSRRAQQAGRTLNYSGAVVESYWSDYFMHIERHGNQNVPAWQAIGEVVGNVWRNIADASAMALQRLPGRIAPRFYKIVASQEQAPNPSSRVLLGRERDALGMRRAVLDWQLGELDRHTVAVALQELGRAFGGAGIGRLHIPMDFATDPWPSCLQGSWHHCGVTRMSASPRNGVVNPDCRVHGVGNLYVAGSSVFPTNGHGNPTLTLVALALRLADHLRPALA